MRDSSFMHIRSTCFSTNFHIRSLTVPQQIRSSAKILLQTHGHGRERQGPSLCRRRKQFVIGLFNSCKTLVKHRSKDRLQSLIRSNRCNLPSLSLQRSNNHASLIACLLMTMVHVCRILDMCLKPPCWLPLFRSNWAALDGVTYYQFSTGPLGTPVGIQPLTRNGCPYDPSV